MSKRTRTLGLITLCVACLGALIFLGFRGNVIYYYETTEAVQKAESQGTDRFRLAGAVLNGSIESEGSTTRFTVTDGTTSVHVVHRGDPPDLFKDGAPVVCEGRWDKDAVGQTFNSELIMIKHGNEYTPPEVEQ